MTSRFKSQNIEANRTLISGHRDFLYSTTAAKKSQNKGFNGSVNGSARVINLCTFPSQPMRNNKYTTGHYFYKTLSSRIWLSLVFVDI